MSNEKDIQNLMSLKDNNFRFNPNTRFKLFLKNELGILSDNKRKNFIIASEVTYDNTIESMKKMCKSTIKDIYFD